MSTETITPTCNFCGKSQDDVRVLVHSGGSYICDECVSACTPIVAAVAGRSQLADIAPAAEGWQVRPWLDGPWVTCDVAVYNRHGVDVRRELYGRPHGAHTTPIWQYRETMRGDWVTCDELFAALMRREGITVRKMYI